MFRAARSLKIRNFFSAPEFFSGAFFASKFNSDVCSQLKTSDYQLRFFIGYWSN